MRQVLGFCIAIAILAGCAHTVPVAAGTVCAPEGRSGEALAEWRADEFVTTNADNASWDLADCLSSTDPVLRDGIGYEGLMTLLRRGSVSEAMRHHLVQRLSTQLNTEDAAGVTAPFSALALSEVARTDRVEAFLSAEERADLVEAAAQYLETVSDYRGFDAADGWRHGVAHGADLAMQLALNPEVDADGLARLREAVAAQVVPASGHFYIYGEPGRLARVILVMGTRGVVAPDDWDNWFTALADPAPLATWGEAYTSQAGLARLHNLRSFAEAVRVSASASSNPALAPVSDGALKVLEAIY